MNWDPSTLARLSAPGFNRPIGSGDVVPYLPTSPVGQSGQSSGQSQDVEQALPGPSGNFSNGVQGAGNTLGGAGNSNSMLNNLSALMPLLTAMWQGNQAAAIPSGQAQAQAQPAAQATPGLSSAQLGAMPPAGAPPPSTGAGASSSAGPDPNSSAGWMTYGPGMTMGASAPPVDTGGNAAGSGSMARGGMVTKGNPSSTKDDVSAKLQHGEFVIPRAAVQHLAATVPGVLAHVMHVSATHAPAPAPMKSPVGPAQRAGGGAPMVSQGRPPVLPALTQPGQGFKDGGPVGYSAGGMVDKGDRDYGPYTR
jgi:hypothetical protein